MLLRNHEGYYDPTAGTAIKAVEREIKMDIRAGDVITFTKPNGVTENVPFAVMGVYGTVATGVRLFDCPTNNSIEITCRERMFAQPEKLEWLNLTRVDTGFVRVMTDDEYSNLREAVAGILGFDSPAPVVMETPAEITNEAIRLAEENAQELIRERAKAEIYKDLYESLMKNLIGGKE